MNYGPDIQVPFKITDLINRVSPTRDEGEMGEVGHMHEMEGWDGQSEGEFTEEDMAVDDGQPHSLMDGNGNKREQWRDKRRGVRAFMDGVKQYAAQKIKGVIKSSENIETNFVKGVLKMPGMRLIKWRNKRVTRLIKDAQGRCITMLAGWPCDEWGEVVRRFHEKLKEIQERMKASASQKFHRRGDYPTLPMGISFRGSQEKPMRLSNHPDNNIPLKDFMADGDVQRVAHYHNYIFKSYYPDLHRLYDQVLT
ncbi:hypothetical protein AAF712_016495 [Marasmius tenuissimus]|uniref:Uncharacterized protein n=1 Tax=Marasmius tenuissimus TaxID=585030 RepID=A0ABR2Z5T7_9AGAR